jgi:Alpha-galactosidase, CBM13 domain
VVDPELPGYQGRRRAPTPVRGVVLLTGGMIVAVLVVLSLIAIVMNAPQKPKAPPVGAPGPTPTLSVPADGSPIPESPPPSPSPSAGVPSVAAPSPPPRRPPRPTQVPPPFRPVSLEAESPANVLDGGARIAPMNSASGGAGVFGLGAPNPGTLRFTGIAVPATGQYLLTIFFQNPDRGDRTGDVTVDGGVPITLRYPPTGGCCVALTSLPVTLQSGSGNVIDFGSAFSQAADIDRIVVSPA